MTTLANKSLVVINAQLMSGSATYRSAGISTYLTNLLSHLHPDPNLAYRVFVGPNALTDTVNLPITRTRFPTEHPLRRIVWEQSVLPIWLGRLSADLIHAPAFVGPIVSSCPQVITVHDLSFLRYPSFFKRHNRVYLTLMTGFSCRRARAVIAVSHFTASEVSGLLRVPQERIHTVYHGVDPRFRPLPQHEIEVFRQRLELPKRFILFLGTLEPRKNLKQLVRAYAKLKDKNTHLVLAGAQGWFYKEVYEVVENLALQDFVHVPGYINGEEQVLWYNAATVFAYLSKYEGFGLPVLEALACGTPTLTSTSSSLPEAAGDAALQVQCDDEEAIVEKLNMLLTDDDLRQRLRYTGRKHAQNFTWQATAENTANIFSKVIDD